MPRLAPDIFRQRLLIEGHFQRDIDEPAIREYLAGLCATLNLRTYSDAIVFSPASGMGSEENAGFDAFIPLIDSGISLYVWSKPRFMSAVLYTCKGFDVHTALAFTRDFFRLQEPVETLEF